MSLQSEKDKDQGTKDLGMQIDIGHMSVGGNVVISGRDGSVYVNTGGNVDHQNQQLITVGGVETTREELDKMVEKIRALDNGIAESDLDAETKEEAEFNLKTIKDQLTASKKPNAKILVKASQALYRLSPVLASGVFALFGEPLTAQIMAGVGGVALQFVESLMRRHTSK